jgi:hypothetical protein
MGKERLEGHPYLLDLRDREKTPGPVGAGLQNAANNYADELPAKETLRIGRSDRKI